MFAAEHVLAIISLAQRNNIYSIKQRRIRESWRSCCLYMFCWIKNISLFQRIPSFFPFARKHFSKPLQKPSGFFRPVSMVPERQRLTGLRQAIAHSLRHEPRDCVLRGVPYKEITTFHLSLRLHLSPLCGNLYLLNFIAICF